MARDGNAKGMKETKFKDTELGKIPEEWEVCNLGSIGVPLMCKRIMKWQTNETAGIPFYKIGTFGKQADAFIAPDIWRYMITHFNYPRKGDILISAAGTIGRMVVFDGQPSYFQDSNIVWIDNDEEKVLNPYLEYAYTKITWSTDASTISRLYNNNLKSALILFPHDKAEQQRIASALSDADALVAELDALIEKKLAIMAGTMQELLTGKRRLQGFSESWVERTLEEICLRHDNLRIPVKASDRKAGYTPYYGANGIQDYVEGYTHDGESILIAEDGANDLDNYPVNFAVGKIWVNNHAHVVKAKEEFIYSYFLYLALKQCNFNDVIVGSSRAKLNASSLMQINVKYPSSLAEQRAIASILSDMDAEIAELEAKRDKYKEVRQGMMQQLLTGKIRLI
jgi:type I restriction enzyme S subunit